VFTTFPQPQVVAPNAGAVNQPQPFTQQPQTTPAPVQQAAPAGFPTVPAGVAVPGMMVPVPQQPGVSPAGTPRRPGGQ
jgi:hypothetical protein